MQRRSTGEFGGLASAVQTETKGATAARQESREKDGGWEQRQEIDQDEREGMRGGIGQGKGMNKDKGKCKGEIDESKDWEERWRVSEENWMHEQWGMIWVWGRRDRD